MTPAPKIPRIRFILVVWGDSYIDTLCQVCIPSLLAEGNIPYFASKIDCVFQLITDQAGAHRLGHEEAVKRLAAHGEIIITPTPIDADHKYGQMTSLQNIGIDAANKAGDGLGFLFVDGVWAKGSMIELVEALENGKRAVASWNMRTNKSAIVSALMDGGHINDGVLTVDCDTLSRLAIEHLHARMHARFWDADRVEDHCGQVYARVADNAILIRTFLVVPYVILPERPILVPPAPVVRGISNTYMDVFLAEAVPNPDDIYICRNSKTHMNVELSPEEDFKGRRRRKTERDFVEWAEMATTSQNLAFFQTTIRLFYGKWPPGDVVDPTEKLVSNVISNLSESTLSLARSDWRRLFRRCMAAIAKYPHVGERGGVVERLIFRSVRKWVINDPWQNSKIPDGGLSVYTKARDALTKEKGRGAT